ncbi:DNA polymerase Y family protein [Anatilimnocola sp. NA78]|uniref:Y-family DNA polymerase n=1 Tax=Anatilimnocola sp. NA78 TaxID=3415683 RepID=UPI003CE49E71
MTRILCIRFPNWPVQRLFNARPQLKRRDVAVYEERKGRRIVASNKLDVLPGMPVAEAGNVQLVLYDPLADLRTLERIAEWCEQFSPVVGLEEGERPSSLFLDITGLAPIFHGEEALAERVFRAFARRGLVIYLTIADSVGAAWGATLREASLCIVEPGDRQTLASLPVEALRLSPPIVPLLKELGIQQVGQLLALPRDSLLARFGQQLLNRLDQATGDRPEPIAIHRAVPDMIAERQFEDPVESRSFLEGVLAELVSDVSRELVARQHGAIQLECKLVSAKDNVHLLVGLFEASNNPRHLLELLRTRLERCVLPGPVVSIRLAVLLSARLVYRQRELFASNHDRERELALLIDRLSSQLGREAVLRPALAADAQPEYAYRYEILAGNVKRPAATDKRKLPDRPLLMEPRPIQLEVLSIALEGPPMQFRFQGEQHRTRQSWGPERIQTGWWRGQYIRRDYYRVESEQGRRYWLFRSRGKWFLHGIFD